MQDKNLFISKMKKLNLFTSINYLFLENKDLSSEDILSLNNKHDIKLDDTDSVLIYKIENSSLSLKGKFGVSYNSECPLEDETLRFNFEKGTYIFLQINENYEDINSFFSLIQEYQNKNNLKVSTNYLIQRFLKEDDKTVCQFCLKI